MKGIIILSGITLANRSVYLDINKDLKVNPHPKKYYLSNVTIFQIVTLVTTNRERNYKLPFIYLYIIVL